MGRRRKRTNAIKSPPPAGESPRLPALEPTSPPPPSRRQKWFLALAVFLEAAWIALLVGMALIKG